MTSDNLKVGTLTLPEVSPQDIINGRGPRMRHIIDEHNPDFALCGRPRNGAPRIEPTPAACVCERCRVLWGSRYGEPWRGATRPREGAPE